LNIQISERIVTLLYTIDMLRLNVLNNFELRLHLVMNEWS